MKHAINFSAAFLMISIVIGCVPNRKYIYLQKNDINAKQLPTDTSVREYDRPRFDYRIQPEDILSIRFESLTSTEYDFFSSDVAGVQALNQQANPLLIGELLTITVWYRFLLSAKLR
jgi:polysaccharide biosynthesis/export protein